VVLHVHLLGMLGIQVSEYKIRIVFIFVLRCKLFIIFEDNIAILKCSIVLNLVQSTKVRGQKQILGEMHDAQFLFNTLTFMVSAILNYEPLSMSLSDLSVMFYIILHFCLFTI
jgi:hypothetical protein